MINAFVLEQIQGLVLPSMLTRSQLLDIYLSNYPGMDLTCKDVIEAAKTLGVKVIYKKLAINASIQDEFKKERKQRSANKKAPVKRIYSDDPIKLIELKTKCTYKEIAKIYNTNANKIYEDIVHYKRNELS